MTRHTYDKEITALLVIHPYNDFISEAGKMWGRIRAVADARKSFESRHPNRRSLT